jgi:hypothetical protein
VTLLEVAWELAEARLVLRGKLDPSTVGEAEAALEANGA